MKFIIIHGAFGSPEGNWFLQLAESLEALGQEVIIPRFPVEDWDELTNAGEKKAKDENQNLKNWMSVFEKEVLPKIKKSEKVCFVGHSLGPVFILHAIEKYKIRLDCAIFVSPFMRDLGGEFWQFKVVNKTFYNTKFDFKTLRKLIPVSYVLYSENDPYVPVKEALFFAKKLGSSTIPVMRAGHMNAEVNLNEFPLVLELCKSRLDLSLYQKYVAHRRELYGVDYIKPSEEVIYLKANEMYDEGIFKFRNLKKHGFCTLLTSYKFWDTQSLYMRECRRAAKRIKDVSRVFVIDKLSDLKRKLFKKQLKLDVESEVKVYFVMLEDLKSLVSEPDFGVWDYEYLCTVDGEKARLSSRKKDIEKGREWEKKVLKKATRIRDIEKDVKKFIEKNS